MPVSGKGEQEKTIAYRFFAAKEPKQGAQGASVSSDTGRLCDASGSEALQFTPSPPNKNRNSDTKGLRFLIFCGIINIKKLKGGYLMKKISILFVSILLLNLFSGCQFNKSTEYDAVDLSYEHILGLNHFKCYASYLDQETTIEGEEAKELYKIVSESNEGIEHSPSSSQNDYIYLVFYNSTSGYPSTDERTEFYGSYYIYSDGLLQFSGSPYHSAVFSYKLKNNIFDDVLKKTFS